ncbi:MAG: hypothetical protein JW819_05140 [Candidatus Krumholzibacteriota bacterium]|nr:hypothetical protein [Candidatus Krumholzibacteriota bacterium]
MLRKLLIAAAILALALPALAATASKDGTPIDVTATGVQGFSVREDFEYNTGGAIDIVCTTSGSEDGWAWYILHVLTNTTGFDLAVTELAFPCNLGDGGVTMPVEWVIYAGSALPGDPYTTAWTYSGDFDPVDTSGTFPATVYTYIDVSAAGIVIPNGASVVWGYENPGLCGQVSYNGVETFGWYSGMWESDVSWGRTAVMQVKANYVGTPTQDASISAVKALY